MLTQLGQKQLGVFCWTVSQFWQPTVPTGLLEMWATLLDHHATLRTNGLGPRVASSGPVSPLPHPHSTSTGAEGWGGSCSESGQRDYNRVGWPPGARRGLDGPEGSFCGS